jgi:hypothetical protein
MEPVYGVGEGSSAEKERGEKIIELAKIIRK